MSVTATALTARRPRRLASHALLVAGAWLMLYPLVWMLASSFKPGDEILSDPGLVPGTFTLDHWAQGWTGTGTAFGGYILNSMIVSAGAVVGNLIACSMAAYAFARLDFRFKRLLFALMLGTIMLPHQVTLIPQYVVFQKLDWINTFLPLLVPKFLAVDAFFVFLMVQFIRGLPRELDHAAEVDGCGPIGVFWRVILPLSRPALITTAIFTFIWTWDDFFSQLIYLSDLPLFTVPLALRSFIDVSGQEWGPLFAMSALSLIPTFGFFLIFQRFLVEGISTTGLKG